MPYPYHTRSIPRSQISNAYPIQGCGAEVRSILLCPHRYFKIGIPFLQVPLSGSVSLRDSFKNPFGEGELSGKVWSKVRSIGMEQGPFHTLQKVWNRRPFHRYGTDAFPRYPLGNREKIRRHILDHSCETIGFTWSKDYYSLSVALSGLLF